MPCFRRRSTLLSLVVTFTAMTLFSVPAWSRDITVFAAASLTNAIERIARTYEDISGDHVRLSLASSSTLSRQIAAGAPADIYISANEKWMDWLAGQDLVKPGSRQKLLSNRLVLIAPADSPLAAIDLSPKTDLLALISDRDRIAIGDPDHVPAGIYAKQALVSLHQWEATAPRLARADNVRAALALVERGEAPLGIVYRTDAMISDAVKVIATFPVNSHDAITYPVALVGNHPDNRSIKMLVWLLGDDAARIFTDYGFETIQPLATDILAK